MNNRNFYNDQSMSSPRFKKPFAERLHLDMPLFYGLLLLIGMGLVILYSADNEDFSLLIKQMIWIGAAFVVMIILAQIPPRRYYQWAPWLFLIGTLLLIAVLLVGHIGKGAQRWLTLGIFRFQPSEIMKIAVPLTLAWFLDKKALPPKLITLFICCILLAIPVVLTAKQPDLGTALIIACTGVSVLFLAGMRWRIIILLLILAAILAPMLWHFLHGYQRERVLTFLNPERDPLGAGYHIIQSKIAIGSGGIFGKGYLQGSQSHLEFLPEHTTDFIFAVLGEEFGLLGAIALIAVFAFVVLRSLYISAQAQDTFSRLVAGSIALTFFLSFFINVGMVSGILPVVGVPLPLVSYGGTAMVTIMAGFGIMMSIYTHRNLVGR